MKSGKQINHEMQPRQRTTPVWWRRLGILCLLLAATAITLPAQTLTTLVSLGGDEPRSSVIQGSDGNLYGTTFYWENGYGNVFKVTPTGTLTNLYSFCAQTNCTDGAYPIAGLVLATDGNFYGTTWLGGAYNNNICLGPPGCGTVFKITPQGTLTTLYSFCAQPNCADGVGPEAGLIQGADGNLYGTTYGGGAYNGGTIFKITRSGTLTTLLSFDITDTEGGTPLAPLVQARDGNFYGTAVNGGAHSYGTVFKSTPGGTLTTLYSFCLPNCTDGSVPAAGLIQATDGNFYGTTAYGGASTACGTTFGCGTVFKMTPGGTLTTLHGFDLTDGAGPSALVQATDGNLYGTTAYGGTSTNCSSYGASSCGTIFKITLAGTLTTLYNFCSQSGCPDGFDPEAGLIQAPGGKLYGTTEFGGTGGGGGTVFSLAVGLGPFVETLPTLGPVGAPVHILGTNLTGTTSVTFNGTAATFTVNSAGTAINTTVPSGATTGTVQVVTPGGTLSSNVVFRVRH